jgi:YrbI family 3-deoxy-D-manno-octulosonate 8-phosphate phosphatase
MTWVALVPLRGGSKSIPGKNIRPIAGRPLCCWALDATVESGIFARVIVSTDSTEIRRVVERHCPDVEVLDRPAELATDTASTESVMLHIAEQIEFDVLALLQATSPLTTALDLIEARDRFERDQLDSLLTAVESHRFFWKPDGTPINYDPAHRPRRQDISPWLMENGAFYFTKRQTLESTKSRLGGKIGLHIMPADSAVEIDEPGDWTIVEHLLRERDVAAIAPLARRIRAVVLDVDGTLTDGGMYYNASGEAMKKFDTRDAAGLEQVQDAGLRVAVITRESSPAVDARMGKLGITEYHRGVRDKLPVLEELADLWGIPLREMVYIGDDVGDLECLNAVGLSACPADANRRVRSACRYICSASGGHGAVREVCDLVMAQRTAGDMTVDRPPRAPSTAAS